MSIYKYLIAPTLMLVSALLIGGMYYPDTLVMSLADTTATFTLLRAVICMLLFGLLFTSPPRSLELRSIVGAGSVFLFIVVVYQFMNFQMFLLDAVVFLEIAIIFGIEALESQKTVLPVGKKRPVDRKIPVYSN